MHPLSILSQARANRIEHTWFWQPNLIVFVSSACVMTLEIVAGRILAPYIGVSLFTWTGIIGLVVTGISIGNYWGGWLADRFASSRLLGILFLAGGLSSLGILAVDVLDQFSYLGSLTPQNLPIILGLGTLIVLLFLCPCVVLGSISPVVAKLAVRHLDSTGRTMGTIYAFGSVGSIIGTFATGFFLISRFGTHAIVWGVGVVLLALGLLFLSAGHRWWAPLIAILLAATILTGGSWLAFREGWLRGPCLRETHYFCIQVREEQHGNKPVRALYLDRLLHSYTSLDDPTHLVYDYEQMYAEIAAYQAQRKPTLRALFIGGGGYTFPRYMEAIYPASQLDVIEIDPGVTQVAHDQLGLSRNTRIVTYNEDARMFLKRPPTQAYDLIMGDAFNDFSVPYHLTTREFNDQVHAWLAHDGYYAVNIIDGPWGSFLRAYTHTLRQTFRYVYLAINIASWRQSPRSTLVLIAGDTPLDMPALSTFDGGDSDPQLARQLLGDKEIDALLAEGRTITLTDRYAPVDQLLVPVFLDQVKR